jgi:DNA-binding HxlR family transcriptional regulator
MQKKRQYEDGCAFAQGLDLVGERWALLVIRELVYGPKRFTDLKQGLAGIATNVLTQRLTDLEAAGIVMRRDLPPPARTQVYDLTDWGRELKPVFAVMGKWAARSPHLRFDWPLTTNASLLSLGATFRFAGETFRASVGGGALTVDPGPHPAPQAVVDGDPNLFLPVLYAGQSIDEAIAAGLRVMGDRAVLERFAGLFPMPDRAPLPTGIPAAAFPGHDSRRRRG